MSKISDLKIKGLNTDSLAENICQRIGSEEIIDFPRVLNYNPEKIKRVSGLGRKTLPNLLRAIEQEDYEVPKITVF